MIVLKFGGSSVADAQLIKKVITIIKKYVYSGDEVSVVISAMGGVTDQLLKVCKSITEGTGESEEIIRELEKKHLETASALIPVQKQPEVMAEVMSLCNELSDIVHGAQLLSEVTPRTRDIILSFGERLSTYIISQALKMDIPQTIYTDARKIIRTDSSFGMAKVDMKISNTLIKKYFDDNKGLKVITGFIASNAAGQTTTLGRSGSDYTATIIGAATDAREVEIWSDTDGVMTADPRYVSDAKSIEKLSYHEAMELSHFGAKILFPLSLQPAMMKHIPVIVKNTFNPEHRGTLICSESNGSNGIIKGITSLKEISIINVEGSGMTGVAGVAARLFNALWHSDINVIFISQASSEHSICLAVMQDDAYRATQVIRDVFAQELASGLISSVNYEKELAIVAVVGEGMRQRPGVAARVFEPLGANNINIKAISQGSSELNISFVIREADLRKALNALHDSMFRKK
ncbi:MAG TPA: aspartate kinase [Bacteroidales bacterium]|nr:aspartate kinase [Bacteroidales bacterium]HCI54621.1 hypothetical protein [Bacteroidales bacterium]HOU95579.1 aspartate kinase [Bacteroidales bacterium]HQG37005.1 aspartate kinase [Bacteroidales bacterium]HQG53153.1 aspartate kinase [Bacteroidales bacterium]